MQVKHPLTDRPSRRTLLRSGAVVAGALLAGTTVGPTIVAAAPAWRVIASGLDNPRGLTLGPLDTLFVAEAGRGGDAPGIPNPEGGVSNFGLTGAITLVRKGRQERIVTGLPSLAPPDGSSATGPVDIDLVGLRQGVVAIGLGGTAAIRGTLGDAGKLLGTVTRVSLPGPRAMIADLAAFEAANNPDGGQLPNGEPDPDSNPQAVLALPGQTLAIDAGGNSLLRIAPNGTISTVAVFPTRLVEAPPFLGLPPGAKIPMQSVPTCVAKGPDGALYVGELTGFPFPVGAANIYRVVPGKAPQVVLSGFTNIIDIAFGPDGLYVLEIARNGLLSGDETGALIRIDRHGKRTEVASAGLVAPGGLAISRKGTIYISNYSIYAGRGQVIQIGG